MRIRIYLQAESVYERVNAKLQLKREQETDTQSLACTLVILMLHSAEWPTVGQHLADAFFILSGSSCELCDMQIKHRPKVMGLAQKVPTHTDTQKERRHQFTPPKQSQCSSFAQTHIFHSLSASHLLASDLTITAKINSDFEISSSYQHYCSLYKTQMKESDFCSRFSQLQISTDLYSKCLISNIISILKTKANLIDSVMDYRRERIFDYDALAGLPE